MPRFDDAKFQDLRLRYRAAHAAHAGCLRAVSEAALSGVEVSAALLEQQNRALDELTKVRAELLAAMAEGAPALSAPEPG